MKMENNVVVVVRLILFILFSAILIYGLAGASYVERNSPSSSDSVTMEKE